MVFLCDFGGKENFSFFEQIALMKVKSGGVIFVFLILMINFAIRETHLC